MSGTIVRVINIMKVELTSSQGPNAVGPEIVVATNVDVSQFRELVLIGRLHSNGLTSLSAKVDIKVRPSAPTDEDPAQVFRSSTVLVASVQFTQGQVAPLPAFSSPVATGFPGFVDVLVQLTQGQTAIAGSATISADLSLKS